MSACNWRGVHRLAKHISIGQAHSPAVLEHASPQCTISGELQRTILCAGPLLCCH